MSLDLIDARLALYPEWLKYWINEKYQFNIELNILTPKYGPEYLMALYEQVGYMFINPSNYKNPLTFNQWLYKNGHDDLVDVLPILLKAIR